MSYKPLHNESQQSGIENKESEEENENLLNADKLLEEEEAPTAVINGSHAHKESEDLSITAPPHRCYKIVRYTLAVGAFVLLFSFLAAAITLVILSPACSVAPLDGQVWWKTTVIYQCYPRSFKDSKGDGNGDLVGIRNSLGYLYDLGINAVWLNPIFKSPQKDNGYDISNYTDIDSLYGTVDELSALLKELHSKGMHLILDFVPNHTSDKHPWFIESRKSRDNPKRDWYVWANASSDGGPPNNWFSLFGGSAWTWDATTRQYYLHQFASFQPDLNYYNPQVRKAMEDIIKFWFDFGVDGFRIDAVIFLLEDPDLQSEPANPKFNQTAVNCSTGSNISGCYNSLIHNETSNYPGIHEIIKSWRSIADSYTDRFLVGETYDPVDIVMTYYGEDNDEFHFPFNFLLLSNTNWTGDAVSDLVSTWMDAMPDGAWPNWVLGNHDNARIANKVGNYLARAINVLLLTLPGTSTTYYGEEILMTDVYVTPNEQHDLNQDRDKERTPMQWNTGQNAGFTNGMKPWLPVATNYTDYNVQSESQNTSSMLRLYKRVVKLITMNEAFRFANYTSVLSNTELFAYHRFLNESNDEFIVVVNFSRSSAVANLSTFEDVFYSPVFELSSANSNREGGKVDLSEITLVGGEAVIIRGRNKEDQYSNDC